LRARGSGTPLAEVTRVRTVIVCAVMLPSAALAEPMPTWEAELGVGYGIMRRGTMESAEMTKSPFAITATAGVPLAEDPPMLGFGGLIAEAGDRNSVGAIGGVSLELDQAPIRLRAAGIWMAAPETLWGAQASLGSCLGGSLAICGDLQVTTYFGGTGLPNDETELQVQFAIGVLARGGR
jgi:hypothetical protein